METIKAEPIIMRVHGIKDSDTGDVIQLLVTVPKHNEQDIKYHDYVAMKKVEVVEEDFEIAD